MLNVACDVIICLLCMLYNLRHTCHMTAACLWPLTISHGCVISWTEQAVLYCVSHGYVFSLSWTEQVVLYCVSTPRFSPAQYPGTTFTLRVTFTLCVTFDHSVCDLHFV